LKASNKDITTRLFKYAIRSLPTALAVRLTSFIAAKTKPAPISDEERASHDGLKSCRCSNGAATGLKTSASSMTQLPFGKWSNRLTPFDLSEKHRLILRYRQSANICQTDGNKSRRASVYTLNAKKEPRP
jgi:hypothetical protein